MVITTATGPGPLTLPRVDPDRTPTRTPSKEPETPPLTPFEPGPSEPEPTPIDPDREHEECHRHWIGITLPKI